MTELLDFYNRHDLLVWLVLIAYIVLKDFQHNLNKISHQLNYTNRYLLLLVQKQYSNKEILEETSDLKPEPGFWSSLFK
jgi:hypothetical protein